VIAQPEIETEQPVVQVVEEEPVIEIQQPEPAPNSAPEILSISLGCNIVTESVSIQVGKTADFFILVDDETPLQMSYSADIDDSSIASVNVDSEGVFLVSGLAPGLTTMPIEVVDSGGLTDSIVLSISIEP